MIKQKYRVLIAEDTELLRRMYSDRLRSDGFEVVAVGNGRDALEKLRSENFDIVMTDVMMPVMSGLDLIGEMSTDEKLKEIPRIILTNLDSDSCEACVLAVRDGLATEYLIKNSTPIKDISIKVLSILDGLQQKPGEEKKEIHKRNFDVFLNPDAGQINELMMDSSLPKRLFCPNCDHMLQLELAKTDRHGIYTASFICGKCGHTFHD